MTDDELRQRFAEVRDADAARAEPAARLVARARAQQAETRPRRWPVLLATATLAALVAVFVWPPAGIAPDEADLDLDAATIHALGSLRRPTDSLLDIGRPLARADRRGEWLILPSIPTHELPDEAVRDPRGPRESVRHSRPPWRTLS